MSDIVFRPAIGDASRLDTAFMAPAEIEPARTFHRGIPQCRITPLCSLDSLAGSLDVEAVWVKDESSRFGLGAFKGLGGVWAMARCLAERLALDPSVGFPRLRQEVRGLSAKPTFVTATAGNHGRGVAWAAEQFGCEAVVLVPEGTDSGRIERIQGHGARVRVSGAGFDEVVGAARALAKKNDWILLQDTAWEGYEVIPRWIVQGYGTMVAEALEQVAAEGSDPPTHVFLQVGVGSFAAAVAAYLNEALGGSRRPAIFSVEPRGSAALLQSVERGTLVSLERCQETAMICLACTDISLAAWPILRDACRGHFACGDRVTSVGQRLLFESGISSGPSGAVGVGLVADLADRKVTDRLREVVGLDAASRVLLFSTEQRMPGRDR